MMRHYVLGLTALLLGLLLCSCDIIIEPLPPTHPGGLDISNARYSTNYRDGAGRSYICDDATTLLSYGFDYRGELRQWSSYLRGQWTGEVKGRASYYPRDPRGGHVDFTYYIQPGAAPLSAADAHMDPQSIIVVPSPSVIGVARLYLSIEGYVDEVNLMSHDIPVIGGCS